MKHKQFFAWQIFGFSLFSFDFNNDDDFFLPPLPRCWLRNHTLFFPGSTDIMLRYRASKLQTPFPILFLLFFSFSDLPTQNQKTHLIVNEKKRGMALNRETIREVNSTATDLFCVDCAARETQDYAPLQRRATSNQKNSHNFKILN